MICPTCGLELPDNAWHFCDYHECELPFNADPYVVDVQLSEEAPV